ncbi:NAD(P)/FAD-dependent oxidoreductase [Mycolicibacterium stellerae]|uniref:NAD(P)/FAD-dependent oxidoreductase n=1 Tax=Mycolicibacterium stellerae TaxID=2358193 RepID=UPI0013DE44F6|nr:NAD(P)/FAD-dependent oxidoreductase [Mycolicibacterium stellerae]
MTGTVIVGAGQAGAQTAFSLREFGYTAPITIVGAEAHHPYQRPPLSKAFLAGTADPQSLLLRKQAFYDKLEIDVRSRCTVRDVEFAGDRGTAYLDTGEIAPFDRLVLAVGGRPRRLDVPGSDLDGVTYLRTIDDAMSICALLGRSNSVVVIGGGFIGLEVAAAARGRDAAVTVVEAAPRLLSRSLAPDMSEFLRDAHETAGVTFHFGAAVTAIEGDGEHVRRVILTDGSQIAADAVIVGIGLEPRLELAERLGLETDGESSSTSIPRRVITGCWPPVTAPSCRIR